MRDCLGLGTACLASSVAPAEMASHAATKAQTRGHWGKYYTSRGILRGWRDGVSASATAVALVALFVVRTAFCVLERHLTDRFWAWADPTSQQSERI